MSTRSVMPDDVGRFITFEGIEGSGKTTQLDALAPRLEAAGVATRLTREPGGTPLGHSLRRLLLDADAPRIDPSTELLLYAADRAQHVSEVIRPALRLDDVVLCDRYLDATLAYQGYGRGLDRDVILALHATPPLELRPRRTVLIDVEPEVGLGRARMRNAASHGPDEGRFEAEALEFHRRVRDGYHALARAEPQRIRIVDGSGSTAEVQLRVIGALLDILPELAEVA